MKTFKGIRIVMMSLIALVVFSFASRAVAAVDAFIWFTDSKGIVTKVKINHDGTFSTSALQAGTYHLSFGATKPGTSATVKLNFTKIEMTYTVQPPKDVASGLSSGKRMHTPVTIVREVDKATPKLMTDLGTVVIDTKGEMVSGTVTGYLNANKTSMDSWDAK
jgi:hypothetical protein